MPNWLFRTTELEDVTITAKVFKEEAIARSPECISARVNKPTRWIEGASNPPQRDFGGSLRNRHNMTGGGLVGRDSLVDSSPMPNVRELIDRFEGGSRPAIRQRISSSASSPERKIVIDSLPHPGSAVEKEYSSAYSDPNRPPRPFKNELIEKAQALNLRLFGSLEPTSDLAYYPERPFQDPSLGNRPLHFKAAPTRVPIPPVRALPPPPPRVYPASGLAYALSRALEDRRNFYVSYAKDSDESYDELSDGYSD